MKIISYYCRKILTWLLPFTCVVCHNPAKRQQDLCKACLMDLPTPSTTCQQCARPLMMTQSKICGYCLKYPPPFDRGFTLYIYESLVIKLIMDLKFGHALTNARLLAELLTEKIQTEWYVTIPLPEAIIPIPLHPNRLKERGFNQAIEIARPIATTLKLPLIINPCQRIKHTEAQAMLELTARKNNIKEAFHISEMLPYQHIAVLDDVMTTGFTMVEFCRVLKNTGIKRIDVWCCARPIF